MDDQFEGKVRVECVAIDQKGQTILSYTEDRVGGANALTDAVIYINRACVGQKREWSNLLITLKNMNGKDDAVAKT